MNTSPMSRAGHLITLFIIVLLSVIILPSVVWAESEPNDSFATADPIGIGLSNAEVNATINPLNDEDYYSFTAVAGRTYVIETYNIQGTGDDATGIWLYDGSQTLITHDQDGDNGTGNANTRIIYTFLTSGTYYVLVKDCRFCSWTGTYSLRILPQFDEPDAEWDVANDNEPNDVRQLANEIQIGLQNAQTHQLFNHTNYVTNGSDYDYYRFTAEAGRTYVIEASGNK